MVFGLMRVCSGMGRLLMVLLVFVSWCFSGVVLGGRRLVMDVFVFDVGCCVVWCLCGIGSDVGGG